MWTYANLRHGPPPLGKRTRGGNRRSSRIEAQHEAGSSRPLKQARLGDAVEGNQHGEEEEEDEIEVARLQVLEKRLTVEMSELGKKIKETKKSQSTRISRNKSDLKTVKSAIATLTKKSPAKVEKKIQSLNEKVSGLQQDVRMLSTTLHKQAEHYSQIEQKVTGVAQKINAAQKENRVVRSLRNVNQMSSPNNQQVKL